jgi:hypothetical protein
MFSALAAAEHSVVPNVRNSSVTGDNEGAVSASADDDKNAGTGYSEYDAIAVNTTSTVNRGLDSDNSAESCRRNECAGCREARAARTDDASGGSGVEGESGEEELGCGVDGDGGGVDAANSAAEAVCRLCA